MGAHFRFFYSSNKRVEIAQGTSVIFLVGNQVTLLVMRYRCTHGKRPFGEIALYISA